MVFSILTTDIAVSHISQQIWMDDPDVITIIDTKKNDQAREQQNNFQIHNQKISFPTQCLNLAT